MIAEYKWPTTSGRTMVDGPTEIEDLDRTGENREIVRSFVDEVLIRGRVEKIADYISAGQHNQHSPEIEDGLEDFGRHLKKVIQIDQSMQYVRIHRLIGQGNFVVVYSHVKKGGDDWAVFDIFRLKNTMIVEHWDVQEKIGPKET